MGEKFLEIKDLNVTYTQNRKNVYAVNGISIRLERGKTLGLVGEDRSRKNYNHKGDNENSAGCGS